MKTTFLNQTIIFIFCSITISYGQIKNQKTETVKIYGNCGMCKKTLETAANKKKEVKVDWDKETKLASISYDSKKTNRDEILKRIALSGYDSDAFLAPDDVYAKLPTCCQYSRVNKTATLVESSIAKNTDVKIENSVEIVDENNQLKPVFSNYFLLKDALVKTDAKTGAALAKELSNAINSVKMDKLANEEHMVWMKVMKDLAASAKKIEETKDISVQREHFIDVSNHVYALIKVSKQENPVYYQHCPMANDGKGANWLSKESNVKNPYYGSMMLTCGEVVETIK